MDTSNNERRQYFRIHDFMQLGYEIVPMEKVAIKRREIQQKQMMLSGFQGIGKDKTTFSLTDFSDPGMLFIAETLQNLSSKLDAIYDLTLAKEAKCEAGELVMVDLSASGIRFACSQRVQPSTILHVRFVLNVSPPKRIDVLAETMRLDVNNDDDIKQAYPYRVAARFLDINEATTELLVQYVFRMQREQLRFLRDCDEGPDR